MKDTIDFDLELHLNSKTGIYEKKPMRSKKWTAGKLVNVFSGLTSLSVLALMGYVGLKDYLNSSSHHAPADGLTVPADDVALTTPPYTAAPITASYAPLGMEITAPPPDAAAPHLTTTEQILDDFYNACEQLPDGLMKDNCFDAHWVAERTGIHPYILMTTIAMETGFREITGSALTQQAQGIMQIQPAYLIDAVIRQSDRMINLIDAHSTEFPNSGALIAAIMDLRSDRTIRTSQSRADRADRIHQQITNGIFSNATDAALHEIRMNNRLAMALKSYETLETTPEAHIAQYSGIASQDYSSLIFQSSMAYLKHNAGRNGAAYIQNIMRCDYSAFGDDLRFSDRIIQLAMDSISAEFELPELSHTTLLRNITNNLRVFPEGEETGIHMTVPNLEQEFNASLAPFNTLYFGESEQTYGEISVALGHVSCDSPLAVATSLHPLARPAELGTRIANLERQP